MALATVLEKWYRTLEELAYINSHEWNYVKHKALVFAGLNDEEPSLETSSTVLSLRSVGCFTPTVHGYGLEIVTVYRVFVGIVNN